MTEITKASELALKRYTYIQAMREAMVLFNALGSNGRMDEKLNPPLQVIRTAFYDLGDRAAKDALLMALYAPTKDVRKKVIERVGVFVAAPNCSINHLTDFFGSSRSYGSEKLKDELSSRFAEVVGKEAVQPSFYRSKDESVEIIGAHSLIMLATVTLLRSYVDVAKEFVINCQIFERKLPDSLDAAFTSVFSTLAMTENNLLYDNIRTGLLRSMTLDSLAEVAESVYDRFFPLTDDEYLKVEEIELRKVVLNAFKRNVNY